MTPQPALRTAASATLRGLNKTAMLARTASGLPESISLSSRKAVSVNAQLAVKTSGGATVLKTPALLPATATPTQKRFLSSTPRTLQQMPDFSAYKRSGDQDTNRVFTYAMIGSLGAVSAVGIKATLVDWLSSLSASADVLALAKVEVDLSTIPEGKNVILKWRGKPVFIRHRTAHEIETAEATPMSELRHPETDKERAPRQEFLVMLGVCTHLGCVPIGDAGDYHGWFCPCHGSHYDISGRIRKGPAPLNLEIPPYEFIDDSNIVIG